MDMMGVHRKKVQVFKDPTSREMATEWVKREIQG